MAKELDIPVLCLSQLSRASERGTKPRMPVLSDLRQSGAIEQDADVVVFIHRPEYYGINEEEYGPTAGIAEINVAKQRNGPTGDFRLTFDRDFQLFGNLEYHHQEPDGPERVYANQELF